MQRILLAFWVRYMKVEVQVQRNFLRFWTLLLEDLGTDTTKFLDLLNPVTCVRKHRYKDVRDVHSFQNRPGS
jgi:hypothetical protein